jgi:hypothetical protein
MREIEIELIHHNYSASGPYYFEKFIVGESIYS